MSDPIARLNVTLEGRYRVESKIGEGGMATAYLATDMKHGREVALKVLKSELGGAPATQRVLREIEIAAKLSHPHILPLFDSGEADGLFDLVMPYVDGDSLRDRLEREGTLPLDQAVTVVSEVADALATLQQQDVGGYLATRPRSGTEWVVTREKGGMWNIDGVPSPREKNTR